MNTIFEWRILRTWIVAWDVVCLQQKNQISSSQIVPGNQCPPTIFHCTADPLHRIKSANSIAEIYEQNAEWWLWRELTSSFFLLWRLHSDKIEKWKENKLEFLNTFRQKVSSDVSVFSCDAGNCRCIFASNSFLFALPRSLWLMKYSLAKKVCHQRQQPPYSCNAQREWWWWCRTNARNCERL